MGFKNEVAFIVKQYATGETTRDKFQRDIQRIDDSYKGANWRTISLAVQGCLRKKKIPSKSHEKVETAVIELYSEAQMSQVWANETVKMVYE